MECSLRSWWIAPRVFLGQDCGIEETDNRLDQVTTGLAYGRGSGTASYHSRACRAWWDTAQNAPLHRRGGYSQTRTRSTSLVLKDGLLGWGPRHLKLGDYSIAGLEDRCVVERKDLPDLIHSFTAERPVFVHRPCGS